MANVITCGGGMIEMPDQVTRSRIDGPDVIGHGEIENSIDKQRRRFDLRGLAGLKRPSQTQISNILRIDLCKRAMPAARVIAVIRRPAIDCRMQQLSGLEVLRGSEGRSGVGSSRVDLQACKLEYSIVSPK